MNTISHYYLTLGAEPNIRKMATTPQEMRAYIDGSMLAPGEWTVTTVYADGHTYTENGRDWIYANQGQSDTVREEEAADRARLAEKQKRLAEALTKYHAGYDNELYIRACYSLPARTQGEWSYVNACVSLSDAALAVCGGQQYGSLTFDELTPEVIRFLAAFVLPQDDALELPF